MNSEKASLIYTNRKRVSGCLSGWLPGEGTFEVSKMFHILIGDGYISDTQRNAHFVVCEFYLGKTD